jgi:hypothetical protein
MFDFGDGQREPLLRLLSRNGKWHVRSDIVLAGLR